MVINHSICKDFYWTSILGSLSKLIKQALQYMIEVKMVIQYALNIKNVEQDDFFEKIRKKYPLRDQRIDKFYNEKDRVRCLYAEVITRYALFNLGVDSNSVVIERDINGKPQLSNMKNLHFNISHSGDWVVCAISSLDVGIDVEEIKDNYIMDIAKNCLTDNEYGQLLHCEQCTQVSKFYKFWTLKESYVKNIGLGMKKSFNEFEFLLNGSKINFFIDGKECADYYFEQYYLDEKHQVALCTKETTIKKCIIIEFEQLRQWASE